MLENFIYSKTRALFEAQLNAGNVLDEAIVFIEDTKEIWNHGTYFDCSTVDISNLATKAEIPTQTTVSGWGFTKNAGTITGVKMNGSSKGTSGVVDLGTVITSHQDISGKLDASTAASTYLSKTDASNTYLGKTAKAASASTADKATQDGSGNNIVNTYATKTALNGKQNAGLKFTNITASNWVTDSTYSDYGYRCDMTCTGVTANDYAEVVFDVAEATSGIYAPVCETKTNIVSIWASETTSITVPSIIITR